MKLLISNEWLRARIEADPDIDIEAGRSISDEFSPTDATAGDRNVVQLRIALGVLVRQLRMRDGLSLSELADRIEVSEDDLRAIEHDPHFTPRPRVIFQLSQYFKVPLSNLSQMAGVTQTISRNLYNEAVRYAARSDEVGVLTEEERRDLDAFVAALCSIQKA
jgi:transcriptional regulator with XRE-family HTH domain